MQKSTRSHGLEDELTTDAAAMPEENLTGIDTCPMDSYQLRYRHKRHV